LRNEKITHVTRPFKDWGHCVGDTGDKEMSRRGDREILKREEVNGNETRD
jgi:hypothetical protein